MEKICLQYIIYLCLVSKFITFYSLVFCGDNGIIKLPSKLQLAMRYLPRSFMSEIPDQTAWMHCLVIAFESLMLNYWVFYYLHYTKIIWFVLLLIPLHILSLRREVWKSLKRNRWRRLSEVKTTCSTERYNVRCCFLLFVSFFLLSLPLLLHCSREFSIFNVMINMQCTWQRFWLKMLCPMWPDMPRLYLDEYNRHCHVTESTSTIYITLLLSPFFSNVLLY